MMTMPPRYIPEMPLPEYAFVPGQQPHPRKDPHGHSYQKPIFDPKPFKHENWERSDEYLYGIDLFNHGYYWEAHEAWESLWFTVKDKPPLANFFRALIKMAAAGVKSKQGSLHGLETHATSAIKLFTALVNHGLISTAGLDIPDLISFAGEIRKNSPRILQGNPDGAIKTYVFHRYITLKSTETDI